MDIHRVIEAADDELIREHLCSFLVAFTQPAFGAMPKREIELKVFELLRGIGAIDENASIYTLMTDLRITRAKATQMLFDCEVRSHGRDAVKLDNEIRAALKRTRFAKEGEFFVLEIESPLALAHLRQRLRDKGHVSDTSFNASLVRAPLVAIVDLMLGLIPAEEHDQIRAALENAGAPPGTAKSVMKAALKDLGKACTVGAADTLVDMAVDRWIGPMLNGAYDEIADRWKSIVSKQ